MFITKKYIPRRKFLRGIGTAMALPLLDAMIPARTALAQTAAKPAPTTYREGPRSWAETPAGSSPATATYRPAMQPSSSPS